VLGALDHVAELADALSLWPNSMRAMLCEVRGNDLEALGVGDRPCILGDGLVVLFLLVAIRRERTARWKRESVSHSA